MLKKLLAIGLCLVMLLTLGVPVLAENETETEEARQPDVVIHDTKTFLKFAENCRLDSYSEDLYVVLEADIDLSETDFTGIPIFCGLFEGNGHRIFGLKLTTDGSDQGLFRYLADTAQVRQLHVQGSIAPGGSRSRVGGIAGQNAGVILECSFEGNISGADYVGGIAGKNTVTGIVENCEVSGELHGDHFVGGITGGNQGVIRTCENRATVNITAQQNAVKLEDISIETLINSEASNTVTDIGGIAGNSTGVIRGCVNHANVGYKHMGYNIGGIAGTQSGYVTECENHGLVQGRKEVGGIIGQLEPATIIEYTEDTLQILQGQLNTMNGLVNRVSYNAQSNAGAISSQIGVLQDQTQSARDAVTSLIPNPQDPQLPDRDTLLAAQNTLSDSLNGMTGTVRGIAAATQNTVSALTRDLQAVSGQIGVMSDTIGRAGENLGGTVTDISDRDTAEDLTGKVEACVNFGDVLGDLNIGGITGAMSMENDADILSDWEQYGEESMNFNSELRAVVLQCENRGVITCGKQYAGGIVGWQTMGLVKQSVNTGKLDAQKASFVGGISGQSLGFIRFCGAKCEIQADSNAGGIAGSAAIATDNLVVVHFGNVNEKVGAILGSREEPLTDTEDPIARNFYLQMDTDTGAIDGISYEGMAQPLTNNQFLVQKSLSDIFKSVQIRFVYEDGTSETVTLAPGGRLSADQIPPIPQKDGFCGIWEGLADTKLTDILFDMEFRAVYMPYRTTLESETKNPAGRPVLLLEGSFTDAAAVTAEPAQDVPNLEEKETWLESWQISTSEAGSMTHLWYGGETENLRLVIRNAAGSWQEAEFSVNGSYLVFSMTGTDAVVALIRTPSPAPWYYYAILAAAAVAVVVLVVVICKKFKKSKAA